MSELPAFQHVGVEPAQRDLEAIVATALDYYLGWLDGDADRLASSLHPEARKRAVVDHGSGALALDELDIPPWLERVRTRGALDLARDPEVIVLDVMRDTASARVLSQRYVDYLHLARFGDRWLIVNVLYETRR